MEGRGSQTTVRSCVIRGSLNEFPDFLHIGTFIDSTHMKLKSTSK